MGFGEFQEILDDIIQTTHFLENHFEIFFLRLGHGQVPLQGKQPHVNGGHGIADAVGDNRGQTADQGHFFRIEQHFLALFKLTPGAVPFVQQLVNAFF